MCNEGILYISETKGKQYLRIHGILCIPTMALQRPYGSVPVELGEGNELLDGSLLL
jgi:hypothetical protein